MRYIVKAENPHEHYIDIEFIVDKVDVDVLEVQLPAWRPGRYELGNFAKNVQKWGAFNENGKALKFAKSKKDRWEVQTKGVSTVHIRYNYYANELNAGSSMLDEDQLYVNPVNCFLYVPAREGEKCVVELDVPKNYQVATGLKKVSKHKFSAQDFQQLADSPFIASAGLQHRAFEEGGVKFHIWFQGEIKPHWDKVERDFRKYTQAQLDAFGDFPVKEYHYLNQIAPYKVYHGVEHQNSTVVALGPSYDVMGPALYDELLGVSSHELYHTWNVKNIRPVEMMPYDFTGENYNRSGYVTEGVTTYMGDLMLLRGRVWTPDRYLKEFSRMVQRHLDNFGNRNLSVADSSFDTWLDGYVAGIPNRKVSIYVEGCMVSFMIDVLTISATGGKASLHTIMKEMYERYGKTGIGYSEEDYRTVIETVSGLSFKKFFNSYVWGTKSMLKQLQDCLDMIGCNLVKLPSSKANESKYGFKVQEGANGSKVLAIHPDSPTADILTKDDVIASVNGFAVNSDLEKWINYFAKDEIRVNFLRAGKLRKAILKTSGNKIFYSQYTVERRPKIDAKQKKAFAVWAGQ